MNAYLVLMLFFLNDFHQVFCSMALTLLKKLHLWIN